MNFAYGKTASDVWSKAARLIHDIGDNRESRDFASDGTWTREIIPFTMQIKDPRQRIVYHKCRPVNPAFAIAEVIWIMSGANDVEFLKFWNPRMKQWSDDGEILHGAYGTRLGLQHTTDIYVQDFKKNYVSGWVTSHFDQLKRAYETLLNVPHSRQVALNIYDAYLDAPMLEGEPRSKDVPCNVVSLLKVKDGKLYWSQIMRSNDLFWGTPYNFIQWMTMQEIVAGWLGLELGTYTHFADSLHVYKRHWKELDGFVEEFYPFAEPSIPGDTILSEQSTNKSDLRMPYEDWWLMFANLVKFSRKMIAYKNPDALLEYVESNVDDYSEAYREWIWCLTGEATRRLGYKTLGLDLIPQMGYYGQSYQGWYDYIEK